MFEVKPLGLLDIPRAVDLHMEILDEEFLVRCGGRFLERYYRAWMKSPYGVATGVFEDQSLSGLLLGSLDPSSHYKSMLSTDGTSLALSLVGQSLRDAQLRDLIIKTRAKRYARALLRVAKRSITSKLRQFGRTSNSGSFLEDSTRSTSPTQAEITHLLIAGPLQGKGLGKLLVNDMIDRSKMAKRDTLVLVTPPDSQARHFYEHLGFTQESQLTNSSGETFIRYILNLNSP